MPLLPLQIDIIVVADLDLVAFTGRSGNRRRLQRVRIRGPLGDLQISSFRRLDDDDHDHLNNDIGLNCEVGAIERGTGERLLLIFRRRLDDAIGTGRQILKRENRGIFVGIFRIAIAEGLILDRTLTTIEDDAAFRSRSSFRVLQCKLHSTSLGGAASCSKVSSAVSSTVIETD